MLIKFRVSKEIMAEYTAITIWTVNRVISLKFRDLSDEVMHEAMLVFDID